MLKALYDFQMTVPQTIGFKRGEIFIFHPSVNRSRNWWLVIASSGQIGYIPSNYVETIQVCMVFRVIKLISNNFVVVTVIIGMNTFFQLVYIDMCLENKI